MTDRKRIIAGNWKMYKTIEETVSFVSNLIPLVKESLVAVYLAVPFTAIRSAADTARGTNIVIGAQNMNDASEGAFTGEIAGKMLKDAGAEFVIIGHSERRKHFRESNALINRKIKRALLDGLQPLLCIGETSEEREEGRAEEVLENQLLEGLDQIGKQDLLKVAIAYEPVWAIGTGKTATREVAQEMHHRCRDFLAKRGVPADQMSLLYGGSVNSDNIRDFMDQPDIDGVLVGGASLSLESFVKIVNYSPKD